MSCIVGLVSKGGVLIGADSAASGEDYVRSIQQPKVIRRGEMLIGVAGSLRSLQLIQYVMPLERRGKMPALEYLVSKFVPTLKVVVRHEHPDNQKERDMNVQLLIGLAGQLYEVDTDGQVDSYSEGFASTGSGYQYALGSLYSTTRKSPRERVLKALAAAAKFSQSVQGPFIVETL